MTLLFALAVVLSGCSAKWAHRFAAETATGPRPASENAAAVAPASASGDLTFYARAIPLTPDESGEELPPLTELKYACQNESAVRQFLTLLIAHGWNVNGYKISPNPACP